MAINIDLVRHYTFTRTYMNGRDEMRLCGVNGSLKRNSTESDTR